MKEITLVLTNAEQNALRPWLGREIRKLRGSLARATNHADWDEQRRYHVLMSLLREIRNPSANDDSRND